MDESIGWARRHDEAREMAAQAIEAGLGLSRWGPRRDALGTGPIREITAAIAAAVGPATDRVFDDLELDEDEGGRALRKGILDSLRGLANGLVDGIADELARPTPQPFTPPAAGSWIRARWLPAPARHRDEPTWDGAWHIFAGDWRIADERSHRTLGRTRCGHTVTLRNENLWTGDPQQDFVEIDELPSVDACRRCHPRPRLRLLAIGGAS